VRELKTYVDHQFVGTLREDNNLWVFEYDPAWSAHPQGFDLSPALPRDVAEHRDGGSVRPVQWYFDNLLPEEDLRRIVAKDAGIKSAEDAFALLEYLGAESAGSLTLLLPGVALPEQQALRPLSFEELNKRIEDLPRDSLQKEAPKRMSIAGAQHKLLVVFKEEGEKRADLYEPVGAVASTHILKPDHPRQETYPASTFLEWLTMQLARAANLSIPRVTLLNVPRPVYLIERFDRVTDAGAMKPETGDTPPATRRLHAIDACQLLNKSRIFKHSGASVEALREVCEQMGDTLTAPLRLFRWLVFNLLVANDDCHLKNLSFLVGPEGISLAPHYDLLATAVYHTRAIAGAEGRWPDVEMAVRLSDEIRNFKDVTPEAVMAAAATLGVPDSVALRAVRGVCNHVFGAFDRVYAEHYPDEPRLLGKGAPAVADANAGADADAAAEQEALGDGQEGGAQDDVLTLGIRTEAQLALERRILRILRYLILPQMRARLPK
jgi:serine/threonine-protein kinase HipA